MRAFPVLVVLWAASGARAADVSQSVTACLNPGADLAFLYRGEAIASRILAQAGIALNWRSDPRNCSPGSILVDLSRQTPAADHPEALAYAQPFEGTHIVLFLDRVRTAVAPAAAPYLLGHVLAHEIVHLLQRVDQHSPAGLMKRRWDAGDFAQMQRRNLTLTPEESLLVRKGLSAR